MKIVRKPDTRVDKESIVKNTSLLLLLLSCLLYGQFNSMHRMDLNVLMDKCVMKKESKVVMPVLNVQLEAWASVDAPCIDAGSFEKRVTFWAGSNANSITACDLNRDGKTDLIVTNGDSHTIAFYQNQSLEGSLNANSFIYRLDLLTGLIPVQTIAQDMDGDGRPDVMVACSGSNCISVFKNISSGGILSFGPRMDLSTGRGPVSIVMNDIDGDGKPDLLVSEAGDNKVAIYRNLSAKGSIHFSAKEDFVTGISPGGISVKDFNGDGKPDVAVTINGGNSILILQNRSVIGRFAFLFKDIHTEGFPKDMSSADFDGDGKPDMAVINGTGETVTLYINTTTAEHPVSFRMAEILQTGKKACRIMTADLNRNKKNDLVVIANSVINVFCNISIKSHLMFNTKTTIEYGIIAHDLVITDFDGDGQPDVGIANGYNNSISVVRNKLVMN